MRLHRFYVSQPLGEEVVTTDVSLIKQWLKVFRYKEGDFVILFNGDGYDYTYSITFLSFKSSTLKKSSSEASFIPSQEITLYLSLIKKDNFELVVQKTTELGVTKIVPIISERSEKKNINKERLEKIITEASEQCGRGDVPVILPILLFKNALESISTDGVSLLFTMNGTPWKKLLQEDTLRDLSLVNLFIGPEGGWSTEEEKMFEENKVIPVSLGASVLRAETAAITACALVLL